MGRVTWQQDNPAVLLPITKSRFSSKRLSYCSMLPSENVGTSPVVQWLRSHLAMHGTRVWSLVRELRSHVPLSNQAHTPQLERPRATRKDPACHNWDLMQLNKWTKYFLKKENAIKALSCEEVSPRCRAKKKKKKWGFIKLFIYNILIFYEFLWCLESLHHFKTHSMSDFLSPYKFLLSHPILYLFFLKERSPSVATPSLSKSESIPAGTFMFSKKRSHGRVVFFRW